MERREPDSRRDRDAWVADHMQRESRTRQNRLAVWTSVVGGVVGVAATLVARGLWEVVKWAWSCVHIGN